MPQAARINPAAETLATPGLAFHFLLTGDQSNGSIAAFELTVPAGEQLPAPPHSHDHYEETIYGIAGVLTFTVDGTPIEVRPGDTLCIPRGAVHRFENRGSTEAKTLAMITPAAIGPEYFRETFAVLEAAAGGPPDKAKMAEIMRRYRLTAALRQPRFLSHRQHASARPSTTRFALRRSVQMRRGQQIKQCDFRK